MSNLVVIEEDALRRVVTEAVGRAVAAALAGQAAAVAGDELAIDPGRLYTAAEANARLGFGGRMTIYEIPESDLPRCKVGPARGALRYLGADLVAYAKGLPLTDVQDLVDGARADLHARLARPSAVTGALGSPKPARRRIV